MKPAVTPEEEQAASAELDRVRADGATTADGPARAKTLPGRPSAPGAAEPPEVPAAGEPPFVPGAGGSTTGAEPPAAPRDTRR